MGCSKGSTTLCVDLIESGKPKVAVCQRNQQSFGGAHLGKRYIISYPFLFLAFFDLSIAAPDIADAHFKPIP
jgi:hypothetical protein